MSNIKRFIKEFGSARIIIALFLLSLFFTAPLVGVSVTASIADVITRFGMNSVMVLSLVPMVLSGCGLNFGTSVGIIGGIFGALIALELNLSGAAGFLTSVVIAIILGFIIGYFYSKILNKVKGDEMIIATYIGYAFIYLMNMFYLVLPFKNPELVQGFKGEGLRVTISLKEHWQFIISKIAAINLGNKIEAAGGGGGSFIPVGMLIFFAICAYLIWMFFKTKTGTAMIAAGSNPVYAKSAGINVDKMRTLSVMISAALSAVGILIYQQSYGFVELYMAPLAFNFPTVAALLLGGASVKKASITNVVIGTLLFQGMLTMTPSVINAAINADISDIVRIIVTNGMILYALTRKGK